MFSSKLPSVRTMVVGLGGTGVLLLQSLQELLTQRGDGVPLVSFPALDQQGQPATDVPSLYAIETEADSLRSVGFNLGRRVARFSRRQIIDVQRHPDRLYDISPLEFESFVAGIYRGLGYYVRRTKRSHDGGVDLLLEKVVDGMAQRYIVQCKHSCNPHRAVGVRLVRELCGVLAGCAATAAILVTNTRFTAAAIKLLRRHRCQVFGLKREDVLALIDSSVVTS
jgi:restriction endonuclease